MSGKVAATMLSVFLPLVCSAGVRAQTPRASVPAAEVNGTFVMPFTGKFGGSSNEITVRALGQGKLRVSFELLYPFTMADGGVMVNTGSAAGIANIEGDKAVFSPDSGPCRITIRFVSPGRIKVDQKGTDADCGFGVNVSASGTYSKVNKRPAGRAKTN